MGVLWCFLFFLSFHFCMIIKGKCCSSGQNDARLHKEILLFSNVESQWNQIEVFIFQASSDRRPQTKCMYGNERCFTFFEGLVQCLGKYLGKLLSHLIPSRKANHFSDLLTLDYNTWLKKAPRVDYQFNFIYSQTVKITEAQNSSCFIFFFRMEISCFCQRIVLFLVSYQACLCCKTTERTVLKEALVGTGSWDEP